MSQTNEDSTKCTSEDHTEDHFASQQLLFDLRKTVEALLNCQTTNLFNIYGGLNRLHVDLEKIFQNGSKTKTNDYWPFIQGLKWLQPESLSSTCNIDSENGNNLPNHVRNDKGSIWLYRSLEKHCLSQKLSWLLSDKKHLCEFYDPWALFNQAEYAEAVLICIKAVELNCASLISEIKPHLFFYQSSQSNYKRRHKRCISSPDNNLQLIKSISIHDRSKKPLNAIMEKNIAQPKLRTWKSDPNLYHKVKNDPKIVSTNSQTKTLIKQESEAEEKPLTNKVKGKSLKNKSAVFKNKRSPPKHVIINHVVEHTPPIANSVSSTSPYTSTCSSLPDYLSSFSGVFAEKYLKALPKKTFMDDGGQSVLPMANRYFPKPTKGQSLTSFLIASKKSRGNAELDRENAHFFICEAVISAMEEIKSKKDGTWFEHDDSDKDVMNPEHVIRIQKQKLDMQQKHFLGSSLSAKSYAMAASPISISSSIGNYSSNTMSDNESIDFPISMQDLTTSTDSLSSDIFGKCRGVPDGADACPEADNFSAEGVALSLISKFSEKQLPRASDLEWLVSEEECPQQALLPLPKSWPIDPDETIHTPLRGTEDWAPPRPQLIFTLFPFTSRKEKLREQNYKCAGCGIRVAERYASKFRYCHYLNRFFCTGCHTNQLALIPAMIIQKWNFARYSVSTFSYRLLEQMYTDPLFKVFQLNKNIGKLSKNLAECKKYREGLYFLKDFILSCPLGSNLLSEVIENDKAIYAPEVYSLQDLVQVRTGKLLVSLKQTARWCLEHVTICPLCKGRGFICEMCKRDDILFPWQFKIVNRCEKCGNCMHKKCWSKEFAPCPKCMRLEERSRLE